MDVLDKCQELHQEFLVICDALDFLDKKIESGKHEDDLEILYREQFRLCMDMADVHEDLVKYLEEASKRDENKFIVNKIKKDIDRLMQVEIVQL